MHLSSCVVTPTLFSVLTLVCGMNGRLLASPVTTSFITTSLRSTTFISGRRLCFAPESAFRSSGVTLRAESADCNSPVMMNTKERQKDAGAEKPAKRQKIQGSGEIVPLYRSEGLLAVNKPLEWTSNDVVSYIRGILERDAKNRGAKPAKLSRRGNKKKMVRVGHGGTLDPLATGVLVIGVGNGTKKLQGFLSGAKKYEAGVKLGFETETLDMEGNVTETAPCGHVTLESVEGCTQKFTGKIMQVPPIFSAIRKDGKKMYEEARKGKTAEELGLEAREVQVYDLKVLPTNGKGESLPCFGLEVECGGGTYIRSLVRDIGRDLNTRATMTSLVRTQQGQFNINHTLQKDDWNADNIFAAIDRTNAEMVSPEEGKD